MIWALLLSLAGAQENMEFDEQVIRGSTASGAVYVTERQARPLPALVPVRVSFRSHLLAPLLGAGNTTAWVPAPPPPAAKPLETAEATAEDTK